jgi:hypothetical protein
MVGMLHKEEDLQKSFVQWLSLQYPKISQCCYAVNHGVVLGVNKIIAIRRAKRQKLMGVKGGIADLFIMKKTTRGKPLIWIEFKVGKNKQSLTQKVFEQIAIEADLPYYLCYNLDDAINIIKQNYDKI